MTGEPAGLAALVAGEPVSAAEVTAEIARLRAGPLADRLPAEGTAAGRQLIRWTTQRLALRRLLEQEARARHLTDAAPAPAREPRRPDPAVLGSAAADVLATSAGARAVFAAYTGSVAVPEADIRAYYEANADRYSVPATWVVRLAAVAGAVVPAGGVLDDRVAVEPATLPATLRDALDTVRDGQVVGPVATGPGSWHVAVREARRPARLRPYDEVRGEIAGQLLARRRQQAFARWLDERVGRLVVLFPGYEHPADPRNPDATHRH